MTNTYTNSRSNTYTETNARYVMGKITDDFFAISNRGFNNVNDDWLKSIKEDIYFVMCSEALEMFQFQFYKGTKRWAIEYTISADGSVHSNDPSGGINYYEIPKDAKVSVVLKRDPNNKSVSNYLEKRGWGNKGEFITDDLVDDGAYSKNGFAAKKGRRGSWNH